MCLGYPLLRGDAATALAEPDSIVLTRTMAKKYFGTIDCLGQTLDINQIHPIRVTGIAEDPPSNASVKFVALASGKTNYGKLASLDAAPQVMTALNITVSTYLRLRPGTVAMPWPSASTSSRLRITRAAMRVRRCLRHCI